MGRLIDADKCPCIICNDTRNAHCTYEHRSCAKFCNWLNSTAYDVEKVVAEWKYSPKENIAICKSCSYEHYLGTYHQYATNFCPNCGAKMNGGKE